MSVVRRTEYSRWQGKHLSHHIQQSVQQSSVCFFNSILFYEGGDEILFCLNCEVLNKFNGDYKLHSYDKFFVVVAFLGVKVKEILSIFG